MKPSAKDILQTLVAFPTITGDYGANHEAIEYIDRFLSERGLYVKRHEFNGFESLVATTQKTKTPRVMLAAHLDVVPAPLSSFVLHQTSGKFLGRGVLDMKLVIAVYLKLVDELNSGLREYDFGVLITTDEEVGGQNGVPKLLEEGYIPKVCILPDGGDNWQIQLHAKGFLYLKLIQRGKTSHGARPWLGENAILKLIRIIAEVEALFPDAGPDTHTFNIGQIAGGQAPNQVADHAETTLDMRFTSEAQKRLIYGQIQEICRQHNTQLEIIVDGPTAEFSLDNSYIAPFAELIQKYTNVEVLGSKTMGTNDARFFTPYDVPCISFYPPGGGHHGPEEWASVEGLEQTHHILKDYLELFAKNIEIETAKTQLSPPPRTTSAFPTE